MFDIDRNIYTEEVDNSIVTIVCIISKKKGDT